MAKMTNEQLKQLQALPLNIKIRKTEQRIREWYEHWEGDVFVNDRRVPLSKIAQADTFCLREIFDI